MVKRSTEIGYHIVATTADNHSPNMKFFTTFPVCKPRGCHVAYTWQIMWLPPGIPVVCIATWLSLVLCHVADTCFTPHGWHMRFPMWMPLVLCHMAATCSATGLKCNIYHKLYHEAAICCELPCGCCVLYCVAATCYVCGFHMLSHVAITCYVALLPLEVYIVADM